MVRPFGGLVHLLCVHASREVLFIAIWVQPSDHDHRHPMAELLFHVFLITPIFSAIKTYGLRITTRGIQETITTT